MSRRILVAYGSKHGGTAGLALAIAQALREHGHDVLCERAGQAPSVESFDAVVIGGALYVSRWLREAKRFVKRHASELRSRPVWMFSSGPLDASANDKEIPATAQVAKLMALVNARGHATFGGRLERDVKGFIASKMAAERAGDWRDWSQVRRWATDIANAVELAPRPSPIVKPRSRPLLAALCAFTAITAIGGGALLVARPDGSALHMPVSALAHTPFGSYLVPGLVLLLVIGGLNAAAGALVASRRRTADVTAFAAGAALLVWLASEVALLRAVHGLQLVYGAIAVATIALALRGICPPEGCSTASAP